MSSFMRALGIGPPKQTVGGFKVQTSIYGSPIPIVYGKARVAGNLIHMPDAPQPNSGGGKSGRASKGATGGQDYFAPVALALCEGPIAGIGDVWRDKNEKKDFTADYQPNGWSLKTGTSSQAAWSYLTTNHPSQAVPYVFTAYVVNPSVTLPNDSLSQYSWEVKGFFPFGGPNSVVDANGQDIVTDFLTNATHGAGWPTARLGDLTTYGNYVAAAGLFCSPVFDSAQPARDHLNEVFEITNSGAVWSDGVLKVIPYGDVPLTANGRTYTPNTTPLYDLGDNDFLKNGGVHIEGEAGPLTANVDLDPVLCDRTDPAVAYNDVTVFYEDRGFDYNRVPAKAEDQFAIETYQRIPMPAMELHAVKSGDVARQVAQIRLQREQFVRNRYRFNLGWKYSLLEPMDLVTLTDANLGLSLTPVRIVSVDELAGEAGFSLVAEDWPFGTASATLYGTGSANGFTPKTNVDPGNTTTPIIFEGPTALQSAPLEIWLGASGGQYWGGCDVWISVDNTNFEKVGQIVGKATFGTTTASLATNAAYPSIDTTHTLAVDTTVSGQTLAAQSTLNFTNLIPLCYLGGREFVAYRDLALTSAFHYDLTHLYRGLYNSTIPASHASGSDFVFCDTTILRVPWPLGYIGQTLYFKFPAFNIYGAALQDLSSVSSVSHVVGQDPIIPGANTDTAIAQGTVSIDANGNASFTVDGPIGTLSWKVAYSTGGYPTDATVLAASPSGSSSVLNVNGFTTLSLGQTIYVSAIPFSGAGATGTQGKSIHIQGAYLNLSATKTQNYGAAAWTPGNINTFNVPADPCDYHYSQDEYVQPTYLATSDVEPGGAAQAWFFTSMFAQAPGCTLTSVAIDVYWSSILGGISVELWYVDASGVGSMLGSASGSNIGWQTLTISVSDSTSGRKYYLRCPMDVGTSALGPFTPGVFYPLDSDTRVAGYHVTWTMPDSKQTL